MNKKLFTLATLGLLAVGSGLNVANAQTNELSNNTKFDGSVWYYIGTAGTTPATDRVFIGAEANATVGATTLNRTVVTGITNMAAMTKEQREAYLWSITPSNINGTIFYYELKNKATGKVLTFKSDGSVPVAAADIATNPITKLSWINGDKYVTGGAKIVVTTGQEISAAGTAGVVTGTGTQLQVFTQDPVGVNPDDLNKIMGDGFALNFPKANPQPAENIFDQKLKAYGLNATIAPVAGTYFAISVPQTVIDNGGVFTSPAEFNASTFVAVSPVEHYGINALPQSDGIGFKFTAVAGRDLIAGTTSKNQINANNAIFQVSYQDEVNKPDQYTLYMPTVYVKKDASKDDQSAVDVWVDAVTSVGVTYVTTKKGGTSAVCKASETNMAKAADLLKADAPAIFNVQFLSNYNANGYSEYGKYLGLSSGSGSFHAFAEPSAMVDLTMPQNQWVITGVNGQEFTFANRDQQSVTFKATLRKTNDANVFEITAGSGSFTYGYFSNNQYYEYSITPVSIVAGQKIRLTPAVIDLNAGSADFSKAQLAELATLSFTVSSQVVSQDIYLTADPSYGVNVSKNASYAAQWEIVKFESLLDSIHGSINYAYIADSQVKSKSVEDKAFTTYAFKLHNDGSTYYLNWNPGMGGYYDLVSTTRAANIPRFVIKEHVNGTVSLVAVAANRDYATIFTATQQGMALDRFSGYLTQQNVYLPATLSNNNTVNVAIEIAEAAPSLAPVSRHATFQSINKGFLAVGEENDAVIAATSEESSALTFWLDTTDVEAYTPSFFISKGIAADTKAAGETRLFLYNAADSADYYDPSKATIVTDYDYYLDDFETVKAIFRPAVYENPDSLTTVVNGKAVGVKANNGLSSFKFQILLADEDVEDEYVIKSVADAMYLTNLNGKIGFTDDLYKALVVTLGAGDPTANEAIEAAGVQVIGGQGVVTVQGAAGKVITIANILGQTIANQVATSDNVTIAAPAGVVVVAVDGEATKVVVK